MQRKNRPPRSGDEGGVFSTVSLSSSSFDDDSHNDNIIFNEGGDDKRAANRKLVFTAPDDDDDDDGLHISSRRGDIPSNTNTTAVQDTAYNIEMTASSSQTISKAPGLAAAASVQQSSSDDTSSPSLVEGLLLLPPGSTTTTAATTTATATTITATVKRNRYGTRPFDIHWLNIDCCGLLCAAFTYTLHMYGMYAYCLVLLPPWLSNMNDDGYRTLSASCYVNRSVFCTISILAMYSHYCAMMTNPGAVPPNALPLPTSDDDDDYDDYEDTTMINTVPCKPPSRRRLNNRIGPLCFLHVPT
jgi:hypothetical protein